MSASFLLAGIIAIPLAVAVLYYLMATINSYVLRNKLSMRRGQLLKSQKPNLASLINLRTDKNVSSKLDVFLEATEETVEDTASLMWLGFFPTVNFTAHFCYRDYFTDSLYVPSLSFWA